VEIHTWYVASTAFFSLNLAGVAVRGFLRFGEDCFGNFRTICRIEYRGMRMSFWIPILVLGISQRLLAGRDFRSGV
jgi:hypothetical protein